MARQGPDYGEYARIYGGGGQLQQGAAQFGAGIGRGFSAIPNVEDRIRMKEDDVIQNSFSPLSHLYTSNVADWKDLDRDVTTSGGAFMSLKGAQDGSTEGSLSRRQKRVAQRKGLLNPVEFIQKYDAQQSAVLPILTKKLKTYQTKNNVSNTGMREYFEDKPKLRDYLLANIPEEQLGDFPYLVDKMTAYKQITKLGEEFGTPDQWSLGEWAWKGPLSLTGPGMTFQASKLLGKGTEGLAAQAGATKKGQKISKEAGELTGDIAGGLAAKKMVPKIVAAIKRKGAGKILKTYAKKKGWKKAAGLAAKGVLGTVGGAMSGGALTALMGAWAMKDIYDLYSVIVSE